MRSADIIGTARYHDYFWQQRSENKHQNRARVVQRSDCSPLKASWLKTYIALGVH